MSKVFVVGGGAAGMFAAIFAARNGHEVHLYEKNEKFGKKIYITGKGRCNLTNNCEIEALFQNVVRNRKFLYSAFYGYNNQDVQDFFAAAGCATKIERGQRVFPVSDHASDVITALVSEMKKAGVTCHLNCEVKEILYREALQENQNKKKYIAGIRLSNGDKKEGDCVILATGGLSYPSTGSTGDGYQFAKKVGHKITDLQPSLVPFEIQESYVKDLQGLSLRNVEVTIYREHKKLYQEFGELLFTHFGVSGPLILTASSCIGEKNHQKGNLFPLHMEIDLKPALTMEQLQQRILREFEQAKNKQFKNILGSLFPSKLIPIMIRLSAIPEDKKVNEITKEERMFLLEKIKHFPMTITGLRGFSEAIITKGGITVKEINPSTMESKLCEGLYFAGEVLDLDALTGGFNLQIAWSTGYLAGTSI